MFKLLQDLKKFLKAGPMGKGVLSSYKKNGYLTNDDRTTIVDLIVPWLLKVTHK